MTIVEALQFVQFVVDNQGAPGYFAEHSSLGGAYQVDRGCYRL